MKPTLLKNFLLFAVLPGLAWAQMTPTTTPQPVPAEPRAGTMTSSRELRPIKGVRELTFAGSGGSDRGFNDSFGGATVGYGMYFNNEWQGVIRQSVNYINPDVGSTRWTGSTRVAADYHFTELGMAMPFIGASFGRMYGDEVHDTWTAGLEVGLKYYLQRKVFVFAMVEYSWFFERGRQIDNNFDEGQFGWSTGIGFNF